MGEIISRRTLTANAMFKLIPPVILCSGWQSYEEAIESAGYQTVCINLPLAKSLAGKPIKSIQTNLTATVCGLLPSTAPVYLTDYEIFFDPRYQLDVIKLFGEISRRNKLIVRWCGSFDGAALVYAEPGYSDHRKYKISDYEIVCVN